MLKIKDNVDLNELEKYDFRKLSYEDDGKVITEYMRKYKDEPDTLTTINAETREIVDYNEGLICDWGFGEDILVKDLTKDGLVEKVED